MKPFIITFLVVLIGGGIISAVFLHFHAAPTPVGYHGNGVSTYNGAMAGTPAQPVDGISEVSANPDQKIISDPNNKAYTDAGLDQQVQDEKNENRPVQSNQPK
jgi:hypothetical protein